MGNCKSKKPSSIQPDLSPNTLKDGEKQASIVGQRTRRSIDRLNADANDRLDLTDENIEDHLAIARKDRNPSIHQSIMQSPSLRALSGMANSPSPQKMG